MKTWWKGVGFLPPPGVDVNNVISQISPAIALTFAWTQEVYLLIPNNKIGENLVPEIEQQKGERVSVLLG